MEELLAFVGAAATGSVGTLVVTTWLDRRERLRRDRRGVYIKLLALLVQRSRLAERASWNPIVAPSEDAPSDETDELEAQLLVDASPEVRRLAEDCYQSLGMIWRTLVMGVPTQVD
ncbi:MAG: hypothetical protein AAF547_01145 [Actinomycetota bacterium]